MKKLAAGLVLLLVLAGAFPSLGITAQKDDVAVSSFSVIINYDLSVESMVAHGKYDWKDDGITSENFPTTRKDKANLVLELVYFDQALTSKEVLKELDKRGLRPAEFHELLAFGVKYPEEQRKYIIVALSSVWQLLDGFSGSLYLFVNGDKRILGLDYFEYLHNSKWGTSCRFAAVRK
ncbi:MAG: hypothetical protein HZB99_01095 [Candidatus Harrisonbacteria bacterium]|nr:hypothetical protein [Candidatus Harrisonbacteria bacterium]